MSLLGKIFAILNVLGALGFVTVASMSYAKRQAWAYAVFRQDLLLQGLPVTADERNAQGEQITDLIGANPKPPLFTQGKPVVTQEEEVRRVKAEVDARLSASSDPRVVLSSAAPLLLPFARTNPQRERLLAYPAPPPGVNDPKKAEEEVIKAWDEVKKVLEAAWKEASQAPPDRNQPDKALHNAFAQAFAAQARAAQVRAGLAAAAEAGPAQSTARHLYAALPLVDDLFPVLLVSPKDFDGAFDKTVKAQQAEVSQQKEDLFKQALNPDPKNKSSEEHRRTIAQLLFGLAAPLAGEQPDAQQAAVQRLITVVGLRLIGPTVQEQAQSLAAIAGPVDAQRAKERGVFAEEQHKVLELIREEAEQVEYDAGLLSRKQQQQATHEEELKKLRRDVKDYEDELKEAQRLTAEHLKVLRDMTASLYQVRRQVREATHKNQEYEKQLRALEGVR
jgi:hypothetical protein